MHPDDVENRNGPSILNHELEELRALAEDARDEAATASRERDAALAEQGRMRAALETSGARLRDVEQALAHSEQARLAQEAGNDVLAEELRVAFEELQVSAEELEEANASLRRMNDHLEAEVTARTLQLGATASRLQFITDALPSLVWTSRSGGVWTWCNQRWVEFTGMSEPDSRELGWLDAIHPDDRDCTMRAWAAADAAGQLHVEHRIRQSSGEEWRWFVTRALPTQRDTGSGPAEWFGTSTDIDSGRRAVIALENSEAQFRDFADASPDVLWIRRIDTGAFEFVSPAFETIWGERCGAIMADAAHWDALLHPEDRRAAGAMLDAVRQGRRQHSEYRIIRAADATQRWIRETAFPVHHATGAVQRAAGIARDITDRKMSESQQNLLMRELDHRVKNALMLAQALAAQTARSTSDAQSFTAAFSARLRAMAAAQDLLTSIPERGVSLRAVVERTLAPYDGRSERVQLAGPPVRLPATQVVILHMAFHELASNAAKFGALSGATGQAFVTWDVERERAGAAMLRIVWEERGGPHVAALPEQQGFGTRLLRHGLPRQLGGAAELQVAPEGIRYVLRAPLTEAAQH